MKFTVCYSNPPNIQSHVANAALFEVEGEEVSKFITTHEPWEEVDLNNNVEWKPPLDDRHTGAIGGAVLFYLSNNVSYLNR
jgi:hypothetical protein